jgi:hypothetical protein
MECSFSQNWYLKTENSMLLLPFTYLLVWFHVLYELEENGLLLLLEIIN